MHGKYRPEIDGLRALAVLAVIINHFNGNIFPGGYLGVDIFFVISGYVITSSLLKRPSKDFKDFISSFYVRRIKRIIPALATYVLLGSIAICIVNQTPGRSLLTGMASLFGLSNIYLLRHKIGYFAQPSELNFFTNTWSLGVEEQFYLVFPLIFWFTGFGRDAKRGARNLFLVVGVLAIASLIALLCVYPSNKPAAYYLMPLRLWEIAAGSLVFVGIFKLKSINQLLGNAPPFLILALIISVMCLPTSLAPASNISVVVLSSILITCLKENTAAFKLLTNQIVVYVGLISYSLYLWHWGVLAISHWTIGVHWWSVPFQAALMLALAIASYRWIEMPIRKGKWCDKAWKTLIASGATLIITSGFIVSLGNSFKEKLYAGNELNKWNMQIFKDLHILNSPDLPLPTVYLIGDSHSAHYGQVMATLAQERLFNLTMHPQGYGLDFISEDTSEHIIAPLRKYRNEFNNGDIIIFSGTLKKYDGDDDWLKSYLHFISQTKDKNLKYFLVSPTPHFQDAKDGYTCGVEAYRPHWSISEDCFQEIDKVIFLQENKHIFAKINNFLLKNREVTYIDTFSVFCLGSHCKNSENGTLLFKDTNHLSSYGSMKTINSFRQALVNTP